MAKKQSRIPAKKAKKKPVKSKRKIIPAKHAGGRPTQYKPEYNECAVKLCLLGATDKAIADFFDVAESTLNKWKLEYPEFSESLKRGKLQADANVAASLYKQAIKGNVTATIFWLKNRKPLLWRDKQTQVLENPDGTPIMSTNKVTVTFKDMK